MSAALKANAKPPIDLAVILFFALSARQLSFRLSLTPYNFVLHCQSLSPEEQEFYKKYGKLPLPKKDLLGKRLNGDRKYFDSGDYALSQAGKSSPKDVGSQHPSPERIPHSNPGAKETATVPVGKESSLINETAAAGGAPGADA
ncbi:hypothetical protein HDU83_004874 [Entophlyctis luteolus]|nr:hypothetical protein HDU83_004874 [Entophlyctis luteolus]